MLGELTKWSVFAPPCRIAVTVIAADAIGYGGSVLQLRFHEWHFHDVVILQNGNQLLVKV